MIDLTPLEQEALDVIQITLEFMTKRSLSRPEYRYVMSNLRDLKVKLTNKQYVCVTGKHSSPCKCKGDASNA